MFVRRGWKMEQYNSWQKRKCSNDYFVIAVSVGSIAKYFLFNSLFSALRVYLIGSDVHIKNNKNI